MNVALVGLGHMGAAIGERILEAGHALTVYNRTRSKAEPLVQRGAAVANDVADLLVTNPVCITVLSDDAALEEVVTGANGLLAWAPRTSILIDMSTVSPASSARVATAAEAAGVRYLRAPVSGNPGVVRAGNLTIIVSGPSDVLDEAQPLLEQIGPRVYYVGEAEQARVVKLGLQVLIGGTAELLAEALVLGEAGGVERRVLLEIFGNSAIGSPFVKYKTGPLLEDDYSPTFTTKMMLKDLRLVLGFAEEAKTPLPLVSELREVVARTIAAGYGEDDFIAVHLWLKQAAAASSVAEEASSI
jgi:3-hydroxyisobutyrate dehydrogenase-like beta-hydroxyacid dehydrogenase